MTNISDDNCFAFNCPYCPQSLEATNVLIGKKVACPACGNEITIPSPPMGNVPNPAILTNPPPLPHVDFVSAINPAIENRNYHKSKSQVFWDLFGWVIGAIMIIFSLSLIGTSNISSILLVAGASLMLPPIRKVFHKFTKKKIPIVVRIIAITVIFFASIFLLGQASIKRNNKEKMELAAKNEKREKQEKELKKVRIEEFQKNRDAILSSIREKFADQKIAEALARSKEYLPADDKELNELHAQISAESEKIKKESKALADQIAKEAAELKKRNDLIKSQFSAWDGSHRQLERYIKEHLNDPDSYEHVETRYSDKGDHLFVITTYRGKNAFNATVTNSMSAKVDLAGNLLEIIR